MSEPEKVTQPIAAPRTTKIAVETDSSGVPDDAHVVVDCDQRGGAAADGIEERHQLRHRGHGDGACHVQADTAADDEADQDDARSR